MSPILTKQNGGPAVTHPWGGGEQLAACLQNNHPQEHAPPRTQGPWGDQEIPEDEGHSQALPGRGAGWGAAVGITHSPREGHRMPVAFLTL